MRPSYITLANMPTERFYLSQANEFNPNEYAWMDSDDPRDAIGLCIDPDNLAESFCYKADYDERFMDEYDEPETATTLAFKLYDEEDNLLFEDEGGSSFWL